MNELESTYNAINYTKQFKEIGEEDIRLELKNLRYPTGGNDPENLLKVVTFGNFVVYKNNHEVLSFSRTRSKEVFTYLIDCGGYPVTTADIARMCRRNALSGRTATLRLQYRISGKDGF